MEDYIHNQGDLHHKHFWDHIHQLKKLKIIKPIKNKLQYESYLQRAYTLMQLDLSPDSTQSDELELLTILIESYEKEHFAITPPQS